MNPTTFTLTKDRQDGSAFAALFRKRTPRSLLALTLGLLPVYGFGLVSQLTRRTPYTVHEMLLYPLVVGTVGLLWIVVVNRVVLNHSFADLNLKGGSWRRDILMGLALTVGLFILFLVLHLTVDRWLPRKSAGTLSLIYGLAADPFLLGLWLGPTVWIGIASFEEISRTFLLHTLWDSWKSRTGQWIAIFGSGLFFGLVHCYQGLAGIVAVGILAVFQGWFYWRFGRLWPLIISHALFDSIQIIWVVSLIRQGVL